MALYVSFFHHCVERKKKNEADDLFELRVWVNNYICMYNLILYFCEVYNGIVRHQYSYYLVLSHFFVFNVKYSKKSSYYNIKRAQKNRIHLNNSFHLVFFSSHEVFILEFSKMLSSI